VYIELLKDSYTNSSMKSTYTKKATRSTSGEEYDRDIPYRPSCSRQQWKAYIPICETRGLKIDGEYLSHLRFADDMLICANTPHELQRMLQELAYESENQGLKMDKSKTKVMMENDRPIYVNQ